jgi:hypothetical protein
MEVVTLEPISLAEYRALPVLSVPYLIHRLIPEKSRIALVGPAKTGKSFFAFQLALAVAQGLPFLGRSTSKGRVLYLQFDTPDPIWKERLDDLVVNGVDLSGDIVLIRPGTMEKPFDLMSLQSQTMLNKLVNRVEPKLVIIDVLSKIHHLDGNTERDMRRVWDVLNSIFGDMALMIVHHTTKGSETAGVADRNESQYAPPPRPSSAGKGSGFIGGEVDANWLLWPTGENQAFYWVESRFDEDIKLQAIRDSETGMWNFPEEATIKDVSEQLVTLCAEHPTLSHHHLAPIVKQRFGLSRASYYRRMAGLKCRHSLSPNES